MNATLRFKKVPQPPFHLGHCVEIFIANKESDGPICTFCFKKGCWSAVDPVLVCKLSTELYKKIIGTLEKQNPYADFELVL